MYFKYSGCPKSGNIFCNLFQALKYDRKPCIFSLSLKFLNTKMHSVWISAYSCDRFNCSCVFYVDMTSILTAPTPQYPFAMLREFLNLFKTSCQTILLALSIHPPLPRPLPLTVCLSPTLPHRSILPSVECRELLLCLREQRSQLWPLLFPLNVTFLSIILCKHTIKPACGIHQHSPTVHFQHEFCYLMK